MKYLPLLLVLLLLNFAISSCTEDETPSANCPNAGTFVKQVRKAKGQVYYDSAQSSYYIRVPNSFDSHDIGYACNLTTEYQKNGQKVRFDGSYYEYDKTVFGIAGNKYYYLSLEAIAIDN